MIKLLHTSDWHLGKRLFRLDRGEEHALFLDWLLTTIKNEKIDYLLVAGDIFDVPTPPHSALKMFFDFLGRLSKETDCQSFIIAGNHDSGALINAPAALYAQHRVSVWGKLEDVSKHWTILKDKSGKEALQLCAIPFFRHYELAEDLVEGEELLERLIYYFKNSPRENLPKIFMGHHLFGMFEAAGSEQVVSLSGLDSIPTKALSDHFIYGALGHIHKPQRISKNPEIVYSGSPLQMRFSEQHEKSVQILTYDGELSVTKKTIPPFRPLLRLETSLADYKKDLKDLKANGTLTPQVEVILHLPAPQVGVTDEIKEYCQKQGMELLSLIPVYEEKEYEQKEVRSLVDLSPYQLFEEFYKTKFPEENAVPDDLKADFLKLLSKVNHASDQNQDT